MNSKLLGLGAAYLACFGGAILSVIGMHKFGNRLLEQLDTQDVHPHAQHVTIPDEVTPHGTDSDGHDDTLE